MCRSHSGGLLPSVGHALQLRQCNAATIQLLYELAPHPIDRQSGGDVKWGVRIVYMVRVCVFVSSGLRLCRLLPYASAIVEMCPPQCARRRLERTNAHVQYNRGMRFVHCADCGAHDPSRHKVIHLLGVMGLSLISRKSFECVTGAGRSVCVSCKRGRIAASIRPESKSELASVLDEGILP